MPDPPEDSFYEELCRRAGCLSIGCLRPGDWRRERVAAAWERWRGCGNGGLFAYLDGRLDVLLDPFGSRPWARSLLVYSFLAEEDPEHPLRRLPPAGPGRASGLIAGYALARDYHLVGRRIGDLVQAFLEERCGRPVRTERGVDASPVWEKGAALFAGIGREGWNGLLYDGAHGCQVHLGTVFADAELPQRRIPPDAGAACPGCRRCERSCPGGALLGQGRLAAARCLAWLAGEKRGGLSWEEQRRLQGRVFGCSACTVVCPGIPRSVPADLAVDAEEVLLMPGGRLERIIRGTALRHAGTSRLKRNCAAALGVFLSPAERLAWRERHLAGIGSRCVRETVLNWPCA